MIRTSNCDGERESRLKAVDAATDELNALVGELLQYVKMETSTPALNLSDVELSPFIRDLIPKIELLHPEKKFEFHKSFTDDGLTVLADRFHLERAIGNLLNNAARHAAAIILINATAVCDGVEVTIDDDGPGIAEADREQVFQPFVRLNESGIGAGLGLAIVLRIAAMHGGNVHASTNQTGGCRMTLWLPHGDFTASSA